MDTVTVSLPSADLGQVMSAMRAWLDQHRVQPSVFRYAAIGGGELLVRLDFTIAGDAKDFALEFRPHQRTRGSDRRRLRHSVTTVRPPPLEQKRRGRAARERAPLPAEYRRDPDLEPGGRTGYELRRCPGAGR
jgi:hypothetical protein